MARDALAAAVCADAHQGSRPAAPALRGAAVFGLPATDGVSRRRWCPQHLPGRPSFYAITQLFLFRQGRLDVPLMTAVTRDDERCGRGCRPPAAATCRRGRRRERAPDAAKQARAALARTTRLPRLPTWPATRAGAMPRPTSARTAARAAGHSRRRAWFGRDERDAGQHLAHRSRRPHALAVACRGAAALNAAGFPSARQRARHQESRQNDDVRRPSRRHLARLNLRSHLRRRAAVRRSPATEAQDKPVMLQSCRGWVPAQHASTP